jgi:hypothetical protein
MKRIALLALIVILSVTGCSSAHHVTASRSFPFGESALAIAHAVPECKNAKAVSASGDWASIATCSLDGFGVRFYSDKNIQGHSDSVEVVKTTGEETYSAIGATWIEIPNVDGDVAGQKTAAQTILKSLKGTLLHVAS